MKMLVVLLAGLAALVSAHSRPPRTLHERTCVGQWLPAVHLHGICIIDALYRSNETEINRLFETESEVFDPLPYDKIPSLVLQRALEEHALSDVRRQIVANIDRSFVEPKTGCSVGFYGYKGKCYTATKRTISFPEAQRECSSIKGSLVTTFNDEIVGLLAYLTRHYIKADVFTGYHQIDDLENNVLSEMDGTNVELDYETDRLQYVVKHEKRGFICVVDANVPTEPLYKPVDLPATPDDVTVYDPHPLPPVKPSVERYLVDLLQFHCPGNYTSHARKQSDVIIHRADLSDMDNHMPYGCHFNRSRGNVVIDLANPTHEPRELQHVCKNLVRLYRIYDRHQRVEYFGIHKVEEQRPSYSSQSRMEITSVGYCSTKKGACGANIPLTNAHTRTPVCYLFKSSRDLNLEIRERRPLRYAQIAPRLLPIFSSRSQDNKDVTVQLDPNAQYHSSHPRLLGKLLSPLKHRLLDYYCKKHLVPLYRILDLKHKNAFLTTDLLDVQNYRKNRDHYSEEQLLGYCTKVQGYCGATQPLYHYRLINDPKTRHQDDAYYNVEQPFSAGIDMDIVCYIF